MPIFKLRYDSKNKVYYPEYVKERYDVPEKIYGDLTGTSVMIWNTYVRDNKSTGVLLTGYKGAGKSLMSNMISNIALDNGLNVYVIEDLEGCIELIAYINNLRNCVVVLDEFGKMFNIGLQNKMLNLFSDSYTSNKLFIVAENRMDDVSSLILNRPGRLLFGLDFKKLEPKVFYEYVEEHKKSDMNNEAFYKDLELFYKASVDFTFDHMSSIMKVHRAYPEKPMAELIKILNIKTGERNQYKYAGYKIVKNGVVETYITSMTIYLDDIQHGYNPNVTIPELNNERFILTNNDITEVKDDMLVFTIGDYELYFILNSSKRMKDVRAEEKEWLAMNPGKVQTTQQPPQPPIGQFLSEL